LDWHGKLAYQWKETSAPSTLLGVVAYAGILQAINSPDDWGQTPDAYGKRVASTAAWLGIRSTLAFGLDTTLREDPRYFRSAGGGFLRRVGHAVRGTILTRTDSGGETISAWRIGSDYGSAIISNLWYPDHLDTVREGLIQGSIGMGFDLLRNIGSEFWPDLRKTVFHRSTRNTQTAAGD